jgi:RNA polymerase sigma-70 factor (ECF subfamily)
LSSTSEQALTERFQSGDWEALGELYRRYFGDLIRYARSLVRDPHEAQDLCNEAFLRAWRYAERYDCRRGTFRAWLFCLAHNMIIERVRTRQRAVLQPAESIEELADSRQALVEAELPMLEWISDRDLLMLIDRLSPDQREALVLRYQLGLDTREIAQVMGRSERAINDLDFRAKRFLAERLQRLGRDIKSFRREWTRVKVRRAPVTRARKFVLAAPAIQAPALQRLPATRVASFGTGRRW